MVIAGMLGDPMCGMFSFDRLGTEEGVLPAPPFGCQPYRQLHTRDLDRSGLKWMVSGFDCSMPAGGIMFS